MQLDLPKWLCEELETDSRKSVQYVIKEILKEYMLSGSGIVVLMTRMRWTTNDKFHTNRPRSRRRILHQQHQNKCCKEV